MCLDPNVLRRARLDTVLCTDLSCRSLMDQPRRALTMQRENPTAGYNLSFKARKPAGVLLSRIPLKHSCQPAQDGRAWRGGGAPPYAASHRARVPVPRRLYHAAPSVPDPQQLPPQSPWGKRTSEPLPWLYGGDEAKIRQSQLQNPGAPRALELSAGRTRSSTKPRSPVPPDSVRLQGGVA